MRIGLSFAIAFGVTWLMGKVLIPWLHKIKVGQSIREDGPTWHMTKQGTPTMGGWLFIIGIGAAIVVGGWQGMVEGKLDHIIVFLFALVFGLIGAADDYVKIKKKRNAGFSIMQKFLLQLAAAIVFVVLLRHLGYLTPNLYIPFLDVYLVLSWPLYMVFAAFVIVATVNAVNITDGIDGLATGVTMPAGLFYTAIAAWWGFHLLGVFAAALVGGLCAFLLYNFYPAKVFMGDTGSLFLGGAVCGLAFALDIPLILILVGLVYLIETLSDIVQIIYFKATKGKRILRMAPLHHHLEMGGWSEVKLVVVFSGIALLACVLSWFGVAGRYLV